MIGLAFSPVWLWRRTLTRPRLYKHFKRRIGRLGWTDSGFLCSLLRFPLLTIFDATTLRCGSPRTANGLGGNDRDGLVESGDEDGRFLWPLPVVAKAAAAASRITPSLVVRSSRPSSVVFLVLLCFYPK
ncbi:hypothetical protein HDK64DRAFT_88344 [Phyllosticta capitalensis]